MYARLLAITALLLRGSSTHSRYCGDYRVPIQEAKSKRARFSASGTVQEYADLVRAVSVVVQQHVT